jgi:hypothetical protein
MKKLTMVLAGILTLVTSKLAAASSCQGESQSFTDNQFQVVVLKYPGAGHPQKTLIIVPPTGGTNYLDMNYGKYFCTEGFDVFVLDHWTLHDEVSFDLEVHDRFYSRAQRAIDLVLENINTPFVGILGTSVGGLHTAVAMAQHSRLDAAFVITGGISIPEVVVTSDQKAMTDAKEKRQKMYGFKTDEEYLKALTKVMPLDPLNFPAPKGKDLGMVIATEDTTVPTKTQENLRNFWQPEAVIELSNGHFWGIVKTWLFHKKDVIAFFEKSAKKKIKE